MAVKPMACTTNVKMPITQLGTADDKKNDNAKAEELINRKDELTGTRRSGNSLPKRLNICTKKPASVTPKQAPANNHIGQLPGLATMLRITPNDCPVADNTINRLPFNTSAKRGPKKQVNP